ncbi:hypothetical protein EP10_002889 [Geobacillus icigianus]|uniref:Uncharacterized protein n=1 Tax=Geobacillus icigianus TaxID=1430331 RepID=A0ABU6BJI8_9BACL|nr:hypothetical protein [Geobacillus icigianus]
MDPLSFDFIDWIHAITLGRRQPSKRERERTRQNKNRFRQRNLIEGKRANEHDTSICSRCLLPYAGMTQIRFKGSKNFTAFFSQPGSRTPLADYAYDAITAHFLHFIASSAGRQSFFHCRLGRDLAPPFVSMFFSITPKNASASSASRPPFGPTMPTKKRFLRRKPSALALPPIR